MAYFQIMTGLRGCYMPDNSYIVQCATRRELKSILADECRDLIECNFIGLSKRNIAWLAAHSWRNKAGAILPYSRDRNSGAAWSIECSRATRAEYLEYCSDGN